MKQLSPTDPVPVLRGDVVFSHRPTGTGAEVIHIRPIGTHEGARLHGFELSLARMLDGRRTAQDVVNRATRIGLPLSVPALEGFVNYLEGHALLARTAGEAASAVSPWRGRLEWDPNVRMQYQAALKAARAGRGDDARLMLDRLLASAPALEDARALRAWLDEHPNGESEGEPFRETFHKAEREWLTQVQAAPAVVQRVDSESLDRAELHAVRRSPWPWVVMVLLLAALAATLLIPVPMVVSVPAQLSPVAVSPVTANQAGTLTDVRVHEGQWVNAGDALYTIDDGTPVVSTMAGVVRSIFVVPSQPLVEGQQLFELEDTRQLRLTAHLDASQAKMVREGQDATIALGQRRAKAKVDAIAGRDVMSTVDNSQYTMEPGHAVVDIDVGQQSLLQRIR